MKKKIALITGISGQDGAYLAKFLLSKKYIVIGTDRRSARSNFWRLRRLGIENKIQFEEMELSENCEIDRLFKKYKNIQEVYNLAAQSFVATSFKSPVNTSNVTALGPLRILEAIRNWNPKIKFYQASSSEMYGDVLEKYQNEKTPFNPRSPYSCAKVFAHYITKNYRESYNMFAVSGILFNHESPLRGEEFVTRKITLGLIKILNGDLDYLELGNINAKRDWGFAGDYVELMWAMLQKKKPKDYVVATGKDYSIKVFVNECLKILRIRGKWIGKGKKVKLINLENKKTLIKINPKFFRPAEVNVLHGDSSLAHHELGWKPKVNFKKLVKMMIDEEIKFYNYN
jgi:GDPmannose 4,6-dehydratase